MKREIKFRAWTGVVMIYRGLHDRNWYTEDKGGKLVRGAHPNDARDLEIMQYTSIKDKNGVEIYEGDIMKWEQGVGVVVWFDDKYGIGSGDIDNYHAIDETNKSELQEGEVIGNIYQNSNI